ncbi:GNAT family N-acetyltransferase [Duganella violaceipulchra]|uniref:GNAT family N-acetyltransferase n=1 Tax=Duganella violaceipulchra TaxID=2849652 RepID=A0AA41L4X2_9BURK|nr:GNAT family N-acetyltransferase [Duganella violaceicalia]MBV6323439.1 GNAT family N-acetyltransferase [Duganella violaceicalia]MCP2007607.1 GNAT superfamily N-acetyltransferase [Duganella violaceicalia]
MNAHIVKLEESPDGGDMQALVKGLTAYNAAQANGETPSYLVATVKDDGGRLVGGLLGATYLGWLQIQVVWLDDSVRGQGYGSELMAIAEREGVRRGVHSAFVETLSFQALPFYEKLGYTVFSRLADFPPGGARYALTKKLEG